MAWGVVACSAGGASARKLGRLASGSDDPEGLVALVPHNLLNLGTVHEAHSFRRRSFHVWERHKLSSDLRGFSSVDASRYRALDMTFVPSPPALGCSRPACMAAAAGEGRLPNAWKMLAI